MSDSTGPARNADLQGRLALGGHVATSRGASFRLPVELRPQVAQERIDPQPERRDVPGVDRRAQLVDRSPEARDERLGPPEPPRHEDLQQVEPQPRPARRVEFSASARKDVGPVWDTCHCTPPSGPGEVTSRLGRCLSTLRLSTAPPRSHPRAPPRSPPVVRPEPRAGARLLVAFVAPRGPWKPVPLPDRLLEPEQERAPLVLDPAEQARPRGPVLPCAPPHGRPGLVPVHHEPVAARPHH